MSSWPQQDLQVWPSCFLGAALCLGATQLCSDMTYAVAHVRVQSQPSGLPTQALIRCLCTMRQIGTSDCVGRQSFMLIPVSVWLYMSLEFSMMGWSVINIVFFIYMWSTFFGTDGPHLTMKILALTQAGTGPYNSISCHLATLNFIFGTV